MGDEKVPGEILYKDEVYAIIGAAIDVHRELGPGFLESVYQSALECECQWRGVPFESQQPIPVRYKTVVLGKSFVADLVCFGKIIVELKSCDRLMGEHQAQPLNYLRATGFRVGLLINFGSKGKLEWQRMVL